MKTKFLTAVLILSGLLLMASEAYAWNQQPVAVLVPIRQYVVVGGRAILDGNDPITPSYDPDEEGYITKYGWDFTYNGVSFIYDYWETSSSYPDGAFDGRTMSYPYNGSGTYLAALRVTDNESAVSDVDTCNIYVGSDSDGDSLPDAWEDLYQELDDANPADADEDSDGDGYNNLCEYLHGSEPNDISDVPNANFPITIYVPSDVNSIQRAINASIDGDTIVVSEGTYYEAIDFYGVSCTLTSTDPYNWDVVANTIIDANDSDANVVMFGVVGNSVLRGFTITGGGRGIHCKQNSPTITNCAIIDNETDSYGAGMYCTDFASPTVTNCVFSGNTAREYGGGGLCNYNNSSPTLVNCVFSDNSAVGNDQYGGRGGGICNYEYCSPTLINCTFSGNSAYIYDSDGGLGGGMFNHCLCLPELTNCIFWGNHADSYGDEIYNDPNVSGSSDPNFSYCDIRGGLNGPYCGGDDSTNGGGNIDSDPFFVDANDPNGPDGIFGTNDDGLRLETDSPCIDTGDPNTDPNDVGTADLSGNDRIVDADHDDVAEIDMGPYESPIIWYVDDDAVTGSNDGSSWEDAFTNLQVALAAVSDSEEIWVAEGTYEPNNGNDRSVSFEMIEGVGIYGGFAGTETRRYQRNRILHETILSGNIGEPADQNDNSYHVVKGANNAVLDGFTITGGMAYISGDPGYGGGIYFSSTSPTISNCTITANKANHYGGGMYTYGGSPTLINCTVAGNYSDFWGGGLYDEYSSMQLFNCVFTGNEANWGGGMFSLYSSPTVTNSTFSGNEANDIGGAMLNTHSSTTVTNCIFWADSADTYPEIWNLSSNPTFSYCDIEGCGGSSGWDPNFGTDGGGNIDVDPCFVDLNNPIGADDTFSTWDDGLRLDANSLCIDAADGNTALLEDILRLDRIDISGVDHNGVGEPNYVDIGAYESYQGLDSDSDGIPDDYEILHDLDPLDDSDASKDADGDGLSNLLEYQIGTWASGSDTDRDGMDDGWEYKYDLDPLDDSDASEDADGDGESNLDEYNDDGNPIVYNTVTVMVYEYDNAGQVTKETVQDGDENDVAVTEYKYDEIGRRWQQRRWANVSDSNNTNDIITLYSYDTRSNSKKTVRKGVGGTDPNSIQTGYDLITENFYDSLGRLIDVNDPNGGNTHYTYYQGGAAYQATDPNGNTTTSYYDHADRLERIVDAEGHYRLSHYDSLGRTIEQVAYDSSSNALMQTRFEYNGLGRVIRRAAMAYADSTDPISTSADMVVDYNYADSNGLLIYERKYYNSGTAATTLYGYDGLGRRTDISDPGGNLTKLSYNEVSQITRRQQIEKDPIGSNDLTITTDYYYDSLGRLFHQVAKPENPDEEDDESWQITTYYYNALGNRTQEIRPNGVVVAYKYTALGQLYEKIADATGAGKIEQKTEYGYDRLGRQTTITGYADGSTAQTTIYTYDSLNRITEVNYPDDNYIAFEYNPAGKVVKRTDQRGIVTEYAYNGTYNMIAKYVDGNGETDDANEIFTYDGLGRMLTATKQVDGLDTVSISEIAYNDIGKITDTNETLFGGTRRETDYTYDQAGLPNSITYPSAHTVNITPDWQGRIDTVTLSATTIATYEYIGSRVAQRNYPVPDPDITYEPTYDNLGRITSADTGTTAKFDYEYDPNTNNISRQIYDHRTNPTDPCTDFSYDNLNRLTVAEYGIDDSNEAFTIDDLGNRENVNVRNGFDVTYSVDANTNRYAVINGLDDAVGYWKMNDNEPNTMVIDSSGNGNHGTAYQNTSVLHTDSGDPPHLNGALIFNGTSDYVDVGNVIGTGVYTKVAWIKRADAASYNNIVSGASGHAFWAPSSQSFKLSAGHNGSWYLVQDSENLAVDTWYHVAVTFDPAVDSGKMVLYKDGALVSGSKAVATGVAPPSPSATTYIGRYASGYYFEGSIDDVMIFDRALSEDEIQTLYNCGNLSYDAAGSLTKDQRGYEYEYDYESRIVKITRAGNDIAEFAYDALGRRTRKIDSAAGETTLYYHNYNWQVLAEYDGSDTLQRTFIYGNYIDEVLLMKVGANDYYYAHDHLYSPAVLANSSGTVLERYEYDAYGSPTIWNADFTTERDNSNYGNPYLFTGRRVDILDSGSLKIQYNRNRYYDYYTGRWLTHDPLGITPNAQKPNRFDAIGQYKNGMSLYLYASCCPIRYVDPWGLIPPGWPPRYVPPPPPPGPLPLRTPDCPESGCPTGWLDPLPSTGRVHDWHESNAQVHFLGRSGDDVEFSHISTFARRLAERRGFYEWTARGGVRETIRSRAEYYAYNLSPCNCTCFGYSHTGVTFGWAINEDDGIDDWMGIINVCTGPLDTYCDLAYTVSCCVKKACVSGQLVGELVCRVRFDMKDKYSLDMWPYVRRLGRPFWHIIHFDKTLDETFPLDLP